MACPYVSFALAATMTICFKNNARLGAILGRTYLLLQCRLGLGGRRLLRTPPTTPRGADWPVATELYKQELRQSIAKKAFFFDYAVT